MMRIENSLVAKSSFDTLARAFEGKLGHRLAAANYMDGVAATVGLIAVGLLSSASFRKGALFGLAGLVIKIGSGLILSSKKENEDLGYVYQMLSYDALICSVAVPILEEAIFRLGMQTCLRTVFAWALPSSMVFLPFGITLSSATIATILVSSAVFGAVHLSNGHDQVASQAVFSFFGGLMYGYLMETDGFIAACAGHIVNNSVLTIAGKVLLTYVDVPKSAQADEPALAQT